MATAAQNIRNLRDQQIQAAANESASLNPATPFPADPDAVFAEEVRKIADASEERARLRTEDAREEYDALVRGNIVRAKEQADEKKTAVTRYHARQQARDQKAEAEVSRRFKVLAESQQGPENAWSMSPEKLRYLAQTADMARPFLSPEQMAALNASVDPFIQHPLDHTEAAQLPERQQVPSQRPETFSDGKYAHVTDNGDGTVLVELPTGEKFKGDWQTVAELQGKALVHTKRWAQSVRDKQPQQPQPVEPQQPTNPNSAVSFAPDGSPQVDFSKIPDVTRWQMDQMAQSLGYSNGTEMIQDQIAQRTKTQELERRLQEREERDFILETSSNFLASAPDFPNTDQSIQALEQIINQNGWEWNNESMQAAHALAIRQGMYQPLSVEAQSANWEQGLRKSNKRPTPPPILSGGNPDLTVRGTDNPYAMPLQDLRQQAIRQALGETDGRR